MKTTTLASKVLICLIAGLVCGETFLRLGGRFLSVIIPIPVVVGISVAIAAVPLVLAFTWHFREKKKATPLIKPWPFWIGAVRYGIAFDLASFGLQKIFHLQFTTPLAMLDEPFSSFSGQWLTWSYFGYSYGFACTIAAVQIGGSLMLLFNRTRLLAVIVLLPVMVNIVFIDYFYDHDLGVLIHAIILLVALIYLLSLDYERLFNFFLRNSPADTSVTVSSPYLKLIGRTSIVTIPLLLIFMHGSRNNHPDLKGKYDVLEQTINGKSAAIMSRNDSLLTHVYFDIANECVFEFNGQDRRMFGTYNLAEDTGLITIVWHYPLAVKGKNLTGTLKSTRENEVLLIGAMTHDSVSVTLKKRL